MKITLRKVGKTPLDFNINSNEIAFKGYLQYDANKLILLKANISGEIDVDCDVCADEFKLKIDEDIEFFIHDGIYESKDEVLKDVVESMDSMFDLEEVLSSEIELIKSDYKSCDKCKTL